MPPHVPAPPSNEPSFPDLESYLKAEINEARRINGAPMIVSTPSLDCAALMHAEDMNANNLCSHNGSDGSRFWERAKTCGTKAASEIIGCGHQDFKELVEAWLRDKPHRDILLDKKNIAMGAARVGDYWVVIFMK
jgi:uncharacterized protein YkwD